MTFETARDLLAANDQSHVLRFWSELSETDRTALLEQIASLDFPSIARMKLLLKETASAASGEEFPPAPVETPTSAEFAVAGKVGSDLIRAGRTGVLVVAGGQGSRLGFEGPKGAYPIGPVTGRSLFYFHTRKIAALAKEYGVRIPFYIMTSDTNDAATRAHFAENDYFGLAKEDVFFFVQGMWPALTAEGKIILDTPSHIFMSPDGHGGTLSALAASGAIADMERRGVTMLYFFQVDNPMVEICDPVFMGLHELRKADISVKVCAKRAPSEGLGIVVKRGDRFAMVEYSELTDEQKNRRRPDGSLYYNYGSVAIHVFSREFLKKEALGNMPLHVAVKKIPFCDEHGKTVKPEKNNGYKFEKFIFDVLPDAGRVLNLAFDRTEEFSPLKNASGDDSPESVRRDLIAKWTRHLAAAGVSIPETGVFEIDPCDPLTPIN